ncbi:hypothetical protein Egran_00847 [Elaphomyces granulatus]|uniref:tripeptidyl-peptidase II n=1 Tax=Elaphomyces granulatus TaxID=519963 RepID=A0A232M4S8_9EURO|nr:hypothetical protein Egran_00847 [Elaphomyces granulatus]
MLALSLSSFALYAVLVILSNGISMVLSVEYEAVEHLRTVPHGWVKGSAANPDNWQQFHIAMHQERAQQFEEMFINISTPGHDMYGRHLNREQVKDYLRPQSETTAAVLSWLRSEGILNEYIDEDGSWIRFNASINQAEHMLNTRFYSFHNKLSTISQIRTLGYAVPRHIRPFIEMIQPTTRFNHIRGQKNFILKVEKGTPISEVDVDCNVTITPTCLRDLYGLGNRMMVPNPRNKLGISSYLEQYGQYDDLQYFLRSFAPDMADANFTVQSIKGGRNDQHSVLDSGEANLDIQYGVSLSYNASAVIFTTGGRGPNLDPLNNTNEPYLEQLMYLLALPDDQLPSVLTTSYGEDEQNVPPMYSRVVCGLFAQLGARGVSVIFASGDSGVGSVCQSIDGKNRTIFNPIFPAACPFVTSVGGTHNINPERAIFFSSGGFSDRFPRPLYQEAAVASYLAILGDRWKGLYNPAGRGFPDVAVQSRNFYTVDKGHITVAGGTSAAAPAFAAIIVHLNSLRIAANKPTLGFLNPWLYGLGGQGFKDIVDGGSTGCLGRSRRRTPYVPYAGFNATKGWDPVTGLGTPLFPELAERLPSQ